MFINTQTNTINQQKLSVIFIYYQKSILIPDFNICTLLKTINPNINIDTIEDYVRIHIFFIQKYFCPFLGISYSI
jgi:hypothetical protein